MIIIYDPELSLRQYHLEMLYDNWFELSNKYTNPSKGQKAAVTRAWNRFAAKAIEMGRDPYILSKQWSQP